MQQGSRPTGRYFSELSRSRKRRFYIGLALYLLGFIVLWSIGSDINRNGYIFRAFLAPFFTLLGIILIPYSLIRDKE